MQVGFTKEGKLIALDLNLYNNAGNTLDLSHSVMDRALLHRWKTHPHSVIRRLYQFDC